MKDETRQTLEQEIEQLQIERDNDIIVDKDVHGDYKKIRRQKRQRRWFIFWNLLSIFYYGISSFISIKRGFKNDIFTYIILRLSTRLVRIMGETGNNVMMRLMGLILMVIAVECFVGGLKPILVDIIQMSR